jgi:hypothetical protein
MILPESRVQLKVIAKIAPFLVFDQLFGPFRTIMPGAGGIKPAIFAYPDISTARETR